MSLLYHKIITPKNVRFESIKIIMLHGLLGSSMNLESSAIEISDSLGISIILPDLPNHGQSFKDLGSIPYENWKDLYQYILPLLTPPSTNFILFGHSFGGWLTMQLIMHNRNISNIKAAIIGDVAPRMTYCPSSNSSFSISKNFGENGNDSTEGNIVSTEKILSILSDSHSTVENVKDQLRSIGMHDNGIMFLTRNSNFHFDSSDQKWKFIYPASIIKKGLHSVASNEEFTKNWKILPELPLLVLKGENSGYIEKERGDYESFQHWFPKSQIKVIPNSGHWMHFEAHDAFCKSIIEFVQNIL